MGKREVEGWMGVGLGLKREGRGEKEKVKEKCPEFRTCLLSITFLFLFKKKDSETFKIR